jgi:xanthine dehydrogenase accessory factor
VITAERIEELTAARVPFVRATVVRAQQPTSARPGDEALVLADGSMEGFVGGQCTEASVRVAALGAMRDGDALLLRVLPEGDSTFPEAQGSLVVVNPCLSGGALEIFLAPQLPVPLVHVLGHNPIADAVAAIAEVLGHQVIRSGSDFAGATAVIVAGLGTGEPEAIRSALAAGVGYVGLVASPRRGAAVLDELALTEQERARVSTPAGLWIGARTAGEIAVSIMAEIVQRIRLDGVVPSEPAQAAPAQAVDPVCGMTVVVGADTPHLVRDGVDYWFCNPGCRDHFAMR